MHGMDKFTQETKNISKYLSAHIKFQYHIVYFQTSFQVKINVCRVELINKIINTNNIKFI